jgi:hypothetical protein
MKKFKFFHGYNVTIDMFPYESYATASIAYPEARFVARDMSDNTYMVNERIRLDREITTELETHLERINYQTDRLLESINGINTRYEIPFGYPTDLGPTGTRWQRFKWKVEGFWSHHETEVYFGIACTFLIAMMGFAFYILIAKR